MNACIHCGETTTGDNLVCDDCRNSCPECGMNERDCYCDFDTGLDHYLDNECEN